MIVATTPGKLVLLGEYAVLHGAPALVAAMERRARVELQLGGAAWQISAPQLGLHASPVRRQGDTFSAQEAGDAQRLRVVVAILAAFARSTPTMPAGGRLTIDTAALFDGDAKLGLGSSAAVAVALWGALAAAVGQPPATPQQLFTAVLAAHRAAQQGRGSGIDVAASAYGGVLEFAVDRSPQPLQLPAGIALLPIWSGHSASTGDFLRRIEAAGGLGSPVAAALTAMTRLAREGVALLRAGNAPGFLGAVDGYGDAMEALGEAADLPIVSASHRQIRAAVRAAGGAYKPSGAGGGDLGLAFCHAHRRATVEAAVTSAGFRPIAMSIAPRGLELSP